MTTLFVAPAITVPTKITPNKIKNNFCEKLDYQIKRLGIKTNDLLESIEFILNRKY